MEPLTAPPLRFPALGLVTDPDPWDGEDPCALARGVRNLLLLATAATLGLLRWLA